MDAAAPNDRVPLASDNPIGHSGGKVKEPSHWSVLFNTILGHLRGKKSC